MLIPLLYLLDELAILPVGIPSEEAFGIPTVISTPVPPPRPQPTTWVVGGSGGGGGWRVDSCDLPREYLTEEERLRCEFRDYLADAAARAHRNPNHGRAVRMGRTGKRPPYRRQLRGAMGAVPSQAPMTAIRKVAKSNPLVAFARAALGRRKSAPFLDVLIPAAAGFVANKVGSRIGANILARVASVARGGGLVVSSVGMVAATHYVTRNKSYRDAAVLGSGLALFDTVIGLLDWPAIRG